AHRAHSVHVGKLCLCLAQSLAFRLCPLSLGNIYHRADHLNKLSVRIQNGMAKGMNVSNCPIWFHNSELNVAVFFLKEHPISCHPELFKVFWVDSLHPLLPHG